MTTRITAGNKGIYVPFIGPQPYTIAGSGNKPTPSPVGQPGPTHVVTQQPTISNQKQGAGVPRDGDWYETDYTYTMAHAAANNQTRVIDTVNLEAILSIGDEYVRIVDKYLMSINIYGAKGAYPQKIFPFLWKGPSGSTLTAADCSKDAGFRSSVESALSGGAQIEWLECITLKPFFENASLKSIGNFELDLAKRINRFGADCERAISQGRSIGEYHLGFISQGAASTNTIITITIEYAFHTRKRKVVP